MQESVHARCATTKNESNVKVHSAHLRTADPDEAAAALRLFCPDAAVHKTAQHKFEYCSHLAVFEGVKAVTVWLPHGGHLEAPTVGDQLLIAMCAAPGSELSIANRRFEILPRRQGGIGSPGMPIAIRNLPGAHGVGLSIERSALDTHLLALTGNATNHALVFDPELSEEAHAGILSLANLLHTELGQERSPLVLTALREALLTALLVTGKHNAGHLFAAPPPAVAPRHVRRAEEYIAAHADEPLTMANLATVAGVSARSIQRAFRASRGMTPMEFLKLRRLDKARQMLLEADPQTTVQAVAEAAGYGSAGRFSSDYRKRFGEAPSATLAQSRIGRLMRRSG